MNERELVARNSCQPGAVWTAHPGTGLVEDEEFVVVVYDEGQPTETQAAHIAYWDPDRVVRLIAALRRALDGFSYEARETAIIMDLGEALFGDHPDYREEWRP